MREEVHFFVKMTSQTSCPNFRPRCSNLVVGRYDGRSQKSIAEFLRSWLHRNVARISSAYGSQSVATCK